MRPPLHAVKTLFLLPRTGRLVICSQRADDMHVRRINYNNGHFSLDGKSFTLWNKYQTIIHSPGPYVPVDRCEKEDGYKRAKPGACNHDMLFVVYPNATSEMSHSRASAGRPDSCDCLMTCVCQSKAVLRRFPSMRGNRGFDSSPAEFLALFQVASIIMRYSDKQSTCDALEVKKVLNNNQQQLSSLDRLQKLVILAISRLKWAEISQSGGRMGLLKARVVIGPSALCVRSPLFFQ